MRGSVERCSLRNHVSLSMNNSVQKWTDWSNIIHITFHGSHEAACIEQGDNDADAKAP